MGFLQRNNNRHTTTPNVALQWQATTEEESLGFGLLQVVALKYVSMDEPLVWDGLVPARVAASK